MIVLASKSPRRKQILEELGYNFKIVVSDSEEVFDDSLSLDEALKKVAEAKNRDVRTLCPEDIILSADTIVCFENKILGKPKNETEAIRILSSLSGQTHQVKTGVCLSSPEKSITIVETTNVTFRVLSLKDILDYVHSGRCMDKAGAYGIQETDFVQEIEGSYSNVVGLPKNRVQALFQELEVNL
ncbi:MAG: Maf family protein [Bacillota bacterium]|nr:Maf family protein [Bacillota bacterium]